jgi:hypothetical protein
MLPVSGCSNEDSYADLDGKNMSPKERSEICTSVKDSKQCNDLSFNVGCGYPSEFKSICFRDGECIVETVPSYCMDTLSQTNNAVQTPSTIIYKRGEADSLFFPYTIDPYGWSRCLSYKEGDPEFCKCADGTMERVEGSCP